MKKILKIVTVMAVAASFQAQAAIIFTSGAALGLVLAGAAGIYGSTVEYKNCRPETRPVEVCQFRSEYRCDFPWLLDTYGSTYTVVRHGHGHGGVIRGPGYPYPLPYPQRECRWVQIPYNCRYEDRTFNVCDTTFNSPKTGGKKVIFGLSSVLIGVGILLDDQAGMQFKTLTDLDAQKLDLTNDEMNSFNDELDMVNAISNSIESEVKKANSEAEAINVSTKMWADAKDSLSLDTVSAIYKISTK